MPVFTKIYSLIRLLSKLQMVYLKQCLDQIPQIKFTQQIWTISMRKINELYICRVCGAEQLDAPWGDDGESPTYEICDCCGVEFGYEDSTLQGIKNYRAKWLDGGAKWNNKKSEPSKWSREEHLSCIPEKYR